LRIFGHQISKLNQNMGKKKFQISLDEALKPDLAYFVAHMEKESKAQANQIFGIKEKSDDMTAFAMEELYKTFQPKAEPQKPNEDLAAFLKQINEESVQQAAAIFKNDK
jgi:polyribonucleotide nucleotidyltransferase